jgi:hypothetical protein
MSKSRIVHRCGAARRMRMDGKAPRSSSDAGAHFHWVFGLGSLVFVKDPSPKTQDPRLKTQSQFDREGGSYSSVATVLSV